MRQDYSRCSIRKRGGANITLSQPARDIIKSQPKVNAWIFTTGRDAAITYRYTCETFRQVAEAARSTKTCGFTICGAHS